MGAQVMRFRLVLLLAWPFVSACGTGGTNGGNPVEPSGLPAIASIEPSSAAPGDRITIRGAGLSGEGVAVAFDGVPALLISATATALLVNVPDVPPGDHAVTVTADGRASTPFRYAVSPALLPTISAIEPAGAHALDEIAITGANFQVGSQSARPFVLVGGVVTGVGLATSSRIVAVVPVLPRGSTTVRVVSGAKASGDFPLEILHSTPVVASVTPNPARAGLQITIEGEHLAGPETAVLVDGIPAAIRPLTANTQIVATVPPVATGTHIVQVRVEGESATPVPLQIDDFDATGTYGVRSEVLSSRSDVASCPAVGAVREFSIELLDLRPELWVRIGLGAPELRGSVDSTGGIHGSALRNCNPLVCGFDPAYSVSGQVERRGSDARYAIDAMVFRRDPCALTEHVTGVRR